MEINVDERRGKFYQTGKHTCLSFGYRNPTGTCFKGEPLA